MKYLYCPRCKQLHVKPWFAIRNRCQTCFGDAKIVPIPPNWLTYTSYALYAIVPALVLIYVLGHTKAYLYVAIAGLVVMMLVAYADLMRGEKYAKTKIKITSADVKTFKGRGW